MLTGSIGIDSRGKLFRMTDDGLRHYADEDDADLMELRSLLHELKPIGGRFYARTNGEIATTWGMKDKRDAEVVANLWFDLDRAKWRPPMNLNQPLTESESEDMLRRMGAI